MTPGLVTLLQVTGLLGAASIVGHLLRARLSPGGGNEAVEALVARIRIWWVMAILIALASLAGRTGIIVLFALWSLTALREFVTLADARRADRGTLAVAVLIVLPLQYWLVWAGQYGVFAVFVPVYCFLLGPILSALRSGTEGFLIRAAEMQWTLMICVFCVSHIPALLTLEIEGYEGRGLMLIAFLVVVAQMPGVLCAVWSRRIGRRRIAPHLSPGLTAGGVVGGVLSATAISALLFWITPFTPVQAAAMAFAIAVTGVVGSLVMAALGHDRGEKHWGEKDWGENNWGGRGSAPEWHGGVVDRFDSVLFSAPIFFHLTLYWWT